MDEELERAREELVKLLDRFPGLGQQLSDLGKAAKAGSNDFKKSIQQLNKDVEKGRATYRDQVRMMEQLSDAIDDLGDTAEDNAKKSILVQQREEVARNASNQRIQEASMSFGKKLYEGSTKLTGELVRSLQDGASGTAISTALLNGAIDAITGTLGGLGGVIKDVSGGLIAAGGKNVWASAIGTIGYTIGAGLEISGELAQKFLKFSVEVLSKELIKTEKAFNTVSASGAVFADGMTAMREASVSAGLTLQQFSNVVQKQSADLAMSGVGVAEGARMVGRVGQIFDANEGRIRESLQNLGFGFEEQAEITATVMANIRRTTMAVNPATLAAETQKYAENLRIISAITGEDAKAKTKQVQEQNQIAAFQNEIAKMGPEVAANIDASMALMTETEKKAFRDRVIYHGSVINQEAAIYESTNRAAAEKGKLLYDKFITNMFDPKAVAEANAQYSQATIDAFRANQALFIGAYATGDTMLQQQQQASIDSYNQAIRMSKEGVDAVLASIGKLKETQDPLTTGMTGATRAAQQMAIMFEDELLPLLKTYAQTTKTLNEGMKTFMEYITGRKQTTTKNETLKSQMLMGGVDVRTNRPLTREELIALREHGTIPELKERTSKVGKAEGGISSGPVSGYTEILHGTEAVVPLPDNRSIPVSLDSSTLTAAVHQQSSLLTEILRAMKDGNSLTSQIVQNSY